MRWSALRTLSLPLLAALCVGCSASGLDRDDLVGDFQADYGFGVETLRLARDGHYDQLFRAAGEDTWTANAGMWELKGGEMPVILLHDSLLVQEAGALRAAYREPVAGVRTLEVRKSLRTISILDPGAGKTFRKVE